MATPESIELLITVKSYPSPSKTYQETVCVAGIRVDSDPYEWIRLYPIRFRDLPRTAQFKKYQLVTLNVTRPSSDTRPETRRPIENTLVLGESLSTKGNWVDRRRFVEPLMSNSMCEVATENSATRKSLGIFRPAEVLDVVVSKEDDDWTPKQQNILNEIQFWSQTKRPLEKIPYVFKLKYLCSAGKCKGHEQSIIDWEIAQLYRNVRSNLGAESDDDEVIAKVKGRIFDICSDKNNYALFVGNQHVHQRSFLILGFFYPKKEG